MSYAESDGMPAPNAPPTVVADALCRLLEEPDNHVALCALGGIPVLVGMLTRAGAMEPADSQIMEMVGWGLLELTSSSPHLRVPAPQSCV